MTDDMVLEERVDGGPGDAKTRDDKLALGFKTKEEKPLHFHDPLQATRNSKAILTHATFHLILLRQECVFFVQRNNHVSVLLSDLAKITPIGSGRTRS